METYTEFCTGLGIDPVAPDSKIHYHQYLEAQHQLEIIGCEWQEDGL